MIACTQLPDSGEGCLVHAMTRPSTPPVLLFSHCSTCLGIHKGCIFHCRLSQRVLHVHVLLTWPHPSNTYLIKRMVHIYCAWRAVIVTPMETGFCQMWCWWTLQLLNCLAMFHSTFPYPGPLVTAPPSTEHSSKSQVCVGTCTVSVILLQLPHARLGVLVETHVNIRSCFLKVRLFTCLSTC